MKKELFDYENDNLESIIEYSNKLLNIPFSDIIEEYKGTKYKTYDDYKNKVESSILDAEINVKSKGQFGNYIEKYFYGYNTNSDSAADFEKVNMELKVTPFKVNKNGSISGKERLVLTILNYMTENLDDFYETHLWEKCQRMLLLFYNGKIKKRVVTDYQIEKVFLFEWFEEDMDVIIDDYKRISQKVKDGRAHELSESDGNYLSTCTKGAGKGRDFRNQPYSDVPAKQRAWELKSSYMTYLLRNKIFNEEQRESIANKFLGIKKPFTELIQEEILKYKGKTDKELFELYGISTSAKNKFNLLIRNLLGLGSDIDKSQEFQKANMNLRVIRVRQNYLPKEDSPFKNYQFKALVNNDDWEESHVYKEICSKRFMFVIFKDDENGNYVLDQVKFWGFPERLVEEAQRVWTQTRNILLNGVVLIQKGKKVITNFPTSTENQVIFTKIHATNTYYEISPGNFIGKGKLSDTDILPDGRRITKHSFWFPKKFLQKVFLGEYN